MSTISAVEIVRLDGSAEGTEVTAVAGFLAGYCGATRRSYATDLRLFAAWCHERNLALFSVRRAHLELFARWMEESRRMRSTVVRRLSTLASFYRYCEQEHFVEENPSKRPSEEPSIRQAFRARGFRLGSGMVRCSSRDPRRPRILTDRSLDL